MSGICSMLKHDWVGRKTHYVIIEYIVNIHLGLRNTPSIRHVRPWCSPLAFRWRVAFHLIILSVLCRNVWRDNIIQAQTSITGVVPCRGGQLGCSYWGISQCNWNTKIKTSLQLVLWSFWSEISGQLDGKVCTVLQGGGVTCYQTLTRVLLLFKTHCQQDSPLIQNS